MVNAVICIMKSTLGDDTQFSAESRLFHGIDIIHVVTSLLDTQTP